LKYRSELIFSSRIFPSDCSHLKACRILLTAIIVPSRDCLKLWKKYEVDEHVLYAMSAQFEGKIRYLLFLLLFCHLILNLRQNRFIVVSSYDELQDALNSAEEGVCLSQLFSSFFLSFLAFFFFFSFFHSTLFCFGVFTSVSWLMIRWLDIPDFRRLWLLG
jgi:hypothetical protein